jgi:hypothetical protein
MPIAVACHSCSAKFHAKQEHVGKRAKCPKCGAVLTITAPAASAPPAAKPSPAPSALAQFFDEELAASPANGPGSQVGKIVRCPKCGLPIPPGQGGCLSCVSRPAAPASEPSRQEPGTPTFSGRFAPQSDAAEKRRYKSDMSDKATNWMAKGGTVLFVVGVIAVVAYWFTSRVTNVTLASLISHDVSAATDIATDSQWLDLNMKDLPGFVSGFQSRAKTGQATATGNWVFTVKDTKGMALTFSEADMQDSGGKQTRRVKSFKAMFHCKLQTMGYFREGYARPDPIEIANFIIQDPTGRTWTLGMDDNGAMLLCNLATMIGFLSPSADPTPLMRVSRESLPYAVFFTALDETKPLDWKIEKSCDQDAKIRTFAAEMLAMSLTTPFADKQKCEGFDPKRYESLIAELAQKTSVAEKKQMYEKLVAESGAS